MHEELEEAYKETVLCYKKENKDLKKEYKIRKKIHFEENNEL